MGRNNDWYKKINMAFLILYPLFVSLFILFYRPGMLQLAFFIIILEVSLIFGLTDKKKRPRKLLQMQLTGLALSIIQAILFVEKTSPAQFIVAFPLYYWAWNSMYQTGLHVTPEKFDEKELQSMTLTTLASIGTVCWIWLTLL